MERTLRDPPEDEHGDQRWNWVTDDMSDIGVVQSDHPYALAHFQHDPLYIPRTGCCASLSPHGYWGCTRPKGHNGPCIGHRAWTDIVGVWPNLRVPIIPGPNVRGEFEEVV